jgi:hypothetical protein
MQSTGNVNKKLVVLKLSEMNASTNANTGGGGPPFFKSRMPIGDIVADVTAFHSAATNTTTIRFHDSMYNSSTEYEPPLPPLPAPPP